MLQKKTLPIKGGTVLVAMDGAEPPMSSNSADFSAVEVSVTETLQSCLHPHPHPIYNPRNFLVDASKTFQRHILVSKDNSHKKEMQHDATLEFPCKISWTHHLCPPGFVPVLPHPLGAFVPRHPQQRPTMASRPWRVLRL